MNLWKIKVLFGLAMFILGCFTLAKALDRQDAENSQRIQYQRDHGLDAVACRDAHGIPVFSQWNGYSVTNCILLPK